MNERPDAMTPEHPESGASFGAASSPSALDPRSSARGQQPPPGPRARFPGQLIYRFRADPLGFLTRVAREHGDFSSFRIGRMRWQLLNDPAATRDVLVTQADRFQKSPALRAAKVTLGEGLLTSEGDFHRRRLSQPAFHPTRVGAAYAPAFVALADDAASRWQDGRVLDVHAEMMRLTLRIVTRTLFSAEIESDVDEIGRHMGVLVTMFRRATSPFAPILNRLPLASNRRFIRSLAAVRGTVDRFVREHREAGADRGDLLSTLIRAHDTGDAPQASGAADDNAETADGESMSDVQLRDELMTLFTAGHETTANALTFTLYLLGRHPDVAVRACGEVDDVLRGRPPAPGDLERMPCLRAVLSESMRLYPPAWLVVREAKADVRVGPDQRYFLPKDSVTIMSQWVAHRDPRWWPEPERFLPDRWLREDPGRPRYAYFPFGGGPRSCIGEAFAWSEAMLVLATILRRWRLAPADDAPLRLEPTITLRPKDPVRMVARRRP
jgi:cytochrome P450